MLLHWMALFQGEVEQRVEDFSETTTTVIAPTIIVGAGAPFGAFALVGTLGSGGALLVAIMGAGLVGLALKGLRTVRDQKNVLKGDMTALRALEAQARACEGDIVRRQGG